MYIPFDKISDSARVWIYIGDRKLLPSEIKVLKKELEDFCEKWQTHGNGMPTSFDLMFDQVIVLSVDESVMGASGCSIDSSTRKIREIEALLGINFLDQGKLAILHDGQNLTVVPALKAKATIEEGILHPESIVLNPMVSKKSDLKSNWLLPAKVTWLKKYFQSLLS